MEFDDGISRMKKGTSKTTLALVVVVTCVVVTAITVPLTYFLHPDKTSPGSSDSQKGDCPTVAPTSGPSQPPVMVEDHERVNCFPGWDDYSEEECLKRGCIYSEPAMDKDAPICYFPSDYGGYRMVGKEEVTLSGLRVTLDRIASTPSLFGGDIERLLLDVEFHSEYRLRIKFYDPANSRFEVPLAIPRLSGTKPENTKYHVTFTQNPFTLKVTRKDTGTVLWDTSLGPLIFSDQFLQITTKLPSSNIYGFGENEHPSFRHDIKWKSWGMFSRDQPPGGDGNLYGVHPFYMNLEEDHNAHGVFLLNSNAMDVALQPAPALTYHTTGGILDLYIFLGPTPENVVQQYTEAIGRPVMPPYWSLGFQLCRYGYNSLDRVKEVVAGMRQYDIPLDIQYGDIDYMERQMDFTVSADRYDGLGEFVDELKNNGTHYIIILDPAIPANETAGSYPPYDRGVIDDVFIKTEDGQSILFGKVWPDLPDIFVNTSKEWEYQVANYRAHAAFPDYMKKSTKDWWAKLIDEFHDEVAFDGIWIDMNEPASFVEGSTSGCSDNKYDNAPFHPRIYGARLADKTACMNAVQHDTELTLTQHYNMHSLFGWSQSHPTLVANEAATGKRGIVISRSTYPGSGKYVGHWLGDNTSIWPHMHKSIIGMMEFNLFGVPYIGADICGFFENTTIDLCRRWMQLGAFYPFSRNHNGLGFEPQDPAAFGADFAKDSRDVLMIRYTLLPYLYTLFYEANTMGSTVVRPLMHEFTSDSATWSIDTQFLWGPALLISPALEQDQVVVDVYVPEGPWYVFQTGEQVDRTVEKTKVKIPTPMDQINLHVRGGYILPTQQPANSTVFSRVLPFGLIVALDGDQSARGRLYWDDGESIDPLGTGDYNLVDYLAANRVLQSTIIHPLPTLMADLVLDDITIHGVKGQVSKVMYQNMDLEGDKWIIDNDKMIVTISNLNHPMDENFLITLED
ncbi:maltase-glucoamylase, intestinal-like [Asterias rubens]|uniref:maltase-glucoamylase, intestinal-like n=1 Tax=Asterias rubens TaxID=7604 RepID=UPI001455A89B|nr:maltase-glucoamylase, intestinal-like [Asterias rubens]